MDLNSKDLFAGARSRNVVLGLAENIDPKYIAIFCGSLRRVSQNIEVVLLINHDISALHKTVLDEHRVRVIMYDRTLLTPEKTRNYHSSSLRWILFHRIMAHPRNNFRAMFDRVLLIDARDSLFLSDPFVFLPDTAQNESVFLAFGEQNKMAIGDCGWNSGWVKGCFGEQVLQKISASPIVCSGMSLGTTDAVAAYLKTMSSILLGRHSQLYKFPQCERNGVDQGTHNVVIYERLVPRIRVVYEEDMPFVNLQTSAYATYNAINPVEAWVQLSLATKGLRNAAVVHQYDRNHALQLQAAAQFIDWVNMRNGSAEWQAEAACGSFGVRILSSDVLAGKCDSGGARVMSGASCCAACLRWDNCNAFTYVQGNCFFKNCLPDREIMHTPQSLSIFESFQDDGRQMVNAFIVP